MEQYFAIKQKYPDCLLFYRIGDFYEMFYDDAKICARELELVLTGKSCGQEERAPMCGVPHHAADTYIHRLVDKGYKVAICEQMEDPALAKGLVDRDVIRIITPGTLTAESMLDARENNYLACLYASGEGLGLAYCDISTGELRATEERLSSSSYQAMVDELCLIGAKEIILNQAYADQYEVEDLRKLTSAYIDTLPEENFSVDTALRFLSARCRQKNDCSTGMEGRDLALRSLSGLFSYLLETQKKSLGQMNRCLYYDRTGKMSLDRNTLRNLEICETLYERKRQGSLLWVLDKTKTAPGARLLRRWIKEPLNDPLPINQRLDSVEVLCADPLLLANLDHMLRQIYDFERLASRIASGSANARDLINLATSLSALPEIKSLLADADAFFLREIRGGIADLTAVEALIQDSITEDPPFSVREGGLIRSSYSRELDDLKASIRASKEWITGLEARERERTGIKSIKVGYNKVFGYYIDVSKANSHLVPDEYIRKQTLVNSERYITPELKETEAVVLHAEEKICRLEYALFTEIRAKIEERVPDIQKSSEKIAELDVLCSFATVSVRNAYVRPTVNESRLLCIEKGKHPVVEQSQMGGLFVANDCYMDDNKNSLLLITGPNMSGKSTYMRQTALIVLMAQCGCFVPCERAEIGVVDRIFTRIGSSDNLSQGASTFYVEMSELSYILNAATEKSLVVLDEIGRGTSTYDGLSLAWATIDYLGEKKIRTLFATHYHELTALEGTITGLTNLNVDVTDENGQVVFLHKLVRGAANRSYGIHVARLAGIPEPILALAETKLAELEARNSDKVGEGDEAPIGEERRAPEIPENQLSLFTSEPVRKLVAKVQALDPMEVTASQAILLLEELKALLAE